MKKKLATLQILTFIGASFCLNAAPSIVNKADTTVLASNIAQPVSELTTTIPSNVIFPASLEDNREQSIDYITMFSEKKRNYLLNTYRKGEKIFPKVVKVLEQFGLPEELKVLIALESGFDANAISKAGAVGYWQIMDDVAREYGLKIGGSRSKARKTDERKNFAKSTVAAARYLQDRCKNLNNDLLLIVAAYNCGVGKIWNAMRHCGKQNPTFWDIKKYIPAETRNYVMNFIALNVVFANYDKFSKKELVFAPKTIRIVGTPVTSEPGAEAATSTLQ